MNITGTVPPFQGYGNSDTHSGALYLHNIKYSNTQSPGSQYLTAGIGLNASNSWSGVTSEAGSNGAHNNMPPYLVVYMWRRSA